MGKAARLKRERREASFEVFCPGVLEVLSIGHGDMKLTLDTSDREEVEKARTLIEEMLRKGYGIYVDTDGGPTKVQAFNPNRMTYSILEVPPAHPELAGTPARKEIGAGPPVTPDDVIPPKKARGRPKKATREVPVAGSRATAVGRTAGG